MRLLPSRIEVTPSPEEPTVLALDGEEAETVFDALGSETARELLAAVYEEPKTPPEMREAAVLFAGDDDRSQRRDAIGRLFGLLATVVVSALAVAVVYRRWLAEPAGGSGLGTEAETEAVAADAAGGVASGLDPVVAFLAGGCVVVAAVGLWWLIRARVRSWA